MKAIVMGRYGDPDVLALAEVPTPVPARDEVLVRVRASSINEWDWSVLHGQPFVNRILNGLRAPRRPIVLGADVAGEVEAVGRDVDRFAPGDAVFGDLWDSWGGFAELACAPQDAFAAKPTNLSFEEAAAAPQAGVLALQGLRRAGPVVPGHRVLVNGAGGGVGTFALQLAKVAGAEITGVDHTVKLGLMRSVGADHVVDYTVEDYLRSGRRYDAILDVVGHRSLRRVRRALTPDGRYVMVGGAMPRIAQTALWDFVGTATRRRRRVHVLAAKPRVDIAALAALLGDGTIRPVVDRTFPLHETAEAYRYYGEGRHLGKVVITVGV